MPTYQYACTECGHAFEQFQSFTDDALTVCPVCEGRLRKVFNAVGVVFKGSGFYRTDSRAPDKDGAAAPAAKAADGSGKDTGKDSGKDAAKDSDNGSGKSSGKEPAASGSASKGPAASSSKGSSASTKGSSAA